MGQLRVISDHFEGKFGVPPKPWKVGRGKDCDIQLVHKSVSRHHCVLTEEDEKLRLEDLGSTYGTFVNGAQISDGYAKIGDKVRFGRILCVFEELGADTVVGKVSVAEPLEPPKEEVPVAPVVAKAAAPVPPTPAALPIAPASPSPPPSKEPAKPEFNLAPAAPKKNKAPSKPQLPASGPV
ncbi:MAG: FHA domain-containing protein, partial [Limisphaerales bacterium]